MTVSIKGFLELYFGFEELKDVLDEIGIPAGKTKGERIQRIQKNWTSRRRKWHDLLDFLEWDYLTKICDDFKINYYDNDDEDNLIRKIKNSKILSDENVFTEIEEDEDILEVEEFEEIGEEHSPSKTQEHSFPRPSLKQSIAIAIIGVVIGGLILSGVEKLIFPENPSIEIDQSVDESTTVNNPQDTIVVGKIEGDFVINLGTPEDETKQKNNLYVRPIPLEPINGTHRLLFEFGTQTYPKAIEIGLTFNEKYTYVDEAVARPNHNQFPTEASNFISIGSTQEEPPIFARRLIQPEITERKSYYLYLESEHPLDIINGYFREYNP